MTPLLLIAAVEAETRILQQRLEAPRKIECAQRTASRGRLLGHDVILLAGGVGKTNAAATTAVALERFAPHGVISFGSAGAYLDSGLHKGDLVLPAEAVMADEGVACQERFLDFEDLGFPSIERPESRYNRFPASKALHARAHALLRETAAQLDVKLACSPSLTVSSCSGTTLRGRELASRWQGGCENMEGAAVAQVCSAWGTPWLELRAISNMVEDRDMSRWNLKRAATNAQQAVATLTKELTLEEWQA